MASNVFLRSPVDNALAREEVARTAPPEQPKTPRVAIDDASAEFFVPANLIQALGEAGGMSEEQIAAAAPRLAKALSGPLSSGRKASEAVRQLLPGAPAGFEKQVVDRANAIYDELYAPPPETPAPADDGGMGVADAAVRTASGVNSFIGSMVRGAGEIAATVGDYTSTPLAEAITGKDYGPTRNALAPVADAIEGFADSGRGAISEEGKQAIRDSSPKGDLFKPSTWEMGENPSLRGYALLGADVLGSMLPVVAASLATGGTAAPALVGGLGGGGAGGEAAAEMIDRMASEKGPDGKSRLETESAYYREMIAKGASPEQALATTREAAARLGFWMTLPVSTLGGAATGKIVDPAAKIATSGPLAARIAGRAAVSAAEEGAQEVGETVAARTGGNLGAGTNESVTDGTFGDFVLGAIGGGAPGAVAGGFSRREAAAAEPEIEPDPMDEAAPAPAASDPLALPAPAIITPPPTREVAPPQPAGPISAALQAGPPPVAPGMNPGTRITIEPEGVSPIGATIIGESAGGLRVRDDDGMDLEIPREEVESGATRIVPEADPVAATDQAPEATRDLVATESATTPVNVVEQPAEAQQAPVQAEPGIPGSEPMTQADMGISISEPETAPAPVEPPLDTPDPAPSDIVDTAGHEVQSPAPRVEQAPDPAAETPETALDAARARLAFVEQQGKTNGWTGRLATERKALRAQIAAAEAEAAPTPPSEPLNSGSTAAPAPATAVKAAPSGTIQPGDVMTRGGKPYTSRGQANANLRSRGLDAAAYDLAEVYGGLVWRPKAQKAMEIATAAAQADPAPTDGQKEGGNYRMGHVRVHGLDVSIENAKGSTRSGKAPDGTEWSVEMPAHYGYIRRTEGNDGDHVDVYLGDNPDSDRAFIIDQFDPDTGKLDEHKTVLGADTAEDALRIYDAGFSDGSGPARRRNAQPAEMSVDEFRAWLRDGDQTKPAQDAEPRTQEKVGTLAAAGDLDRARGIAAYRNMSFTPEKRADSDIAGYVSGVNDLRAEMQKLVTNPDQQAALDAGMERFRQRYISHMNAMWDASSRTASPMITGPARFPTESNRKRLDAYNKRANEFLEWHAKAKAAIKRSIAASRTTDQKVDDEWKGIEREVLHGVAAAKDIDQTGKGDRAYFMNLLFGKIERLAQAGNVEMTRRALDMIRGAQEKHGLNKPMFTERHRIWSLREVAEAVAGKQAKAVEEGDQTIARFDGAEIVASPEDDRVRISFDSRVSKEIADALKAEGWRWSPTNSAWQRKLTNAARHSAERIVGLHFTREAAPATKTQNSDPKSTKTQAATLAPEPEPEPDKLSGIEPAASPAEARTASHVDAIPEADRESLRRGSWTKAAVDAHLRDGRTVMDTGQMTPEAKRWLAGQRKKGNLEIVARWGMGNLDKPVLRMKGVPLAEGEAKRLSFFPYIPEALIASDLTQQRAPEAAQPRETDGRFASPETEVEPGRLIEGDGSAFSISYEPPKMGFRDSGALRAHITRGPLGEVVGKLIDAGKVVIHETEESLPGSPALESRADVIAAWQDALRRLLQGKIPGNSDLPAGPVTAVLRALGVPSGAMVMRASKARKIIQDHPDLGGRAFLNLPALLADPLRVFRQDGKESDLLMETRARAADGSPVVVAVKSVGVNARGDQATVLLSAYPWANAETRSAELIRSGSLLYDRDGRSAAESEPTGAISLKGSAKDLSTRAPAKKILSYSDVFKGQPKASRAPLSVVTSDGKPIRSKGQAAQKLRFLGIDPADYDLRPDADGAFTATPKERGPVQGMTTPDGTIHLVARNLNGQTAMPVLLHEAFHAGAEPLVGEAGWRTIVDKLGTALERAEERRRSGERKESDATFWDAALRRLDAAYVRPEQRAEEFGAYAIEEAEKAPPGIRAWVDSLVGKVKAFLLRRFGRQFGEVTPEQLRALAAAALRSGLPGRPLMRSARLSQAEEDRWAAEIILDLAAEEDLFQNPPAKASTIRGVFSEIMPDVKYHGYTEDPSELEGKNGATRIYRLETRSGHQIAIYEDRDEGEVWVDISRMEKGEAGSGVYQAVADYAFNTRRVFKGDPDGLTDIALRRRNEMMLSSALKHRSTDHLAPHPRQLEGDPSLGVPPLRWRDGDIVGNVKSMIDVSVQSVAHHAPEILSARYDVATRAFRTGQGEPLTDRTLDEWSHSNERIRAAGAGRSTLKRYILLNTLARAESVQRSGLLELALRQPGQLVSGARGIFYSIAPGIPATTAAQMDAMERGLIGHLLTKAMEGGRDGQVSILGMVPGRPLFAEIAKRMPSAQEYLRLKGEMDALRNEWHARMDGTAQAWRKLIGKDGAANKRLMDLMHDATLAGIDPSQTFKAGPDKARKRTAEERAADFAELRRRFRTLPPQFQEMFGKIRDEYKALNDEFDKTLLANVERSMEVGIRNAERAHEAAMERIRDDGLQDDERAAAVAAADSKLASVKYRGKANRRARMSDLRAEFETRTVPAPYFPLARFGSFFVTTRDAETGEVLGFSTFENPKEQEAFAKEQRASKGVKVEVGTLGETPTRGMVDPQFVAAVESILIEAKVPDAVLDSVWQRWLETMPDLSLRKSRIHRKGTPGFSSDALRAFGHHMFHGSHQLARLKYAILMDEALAQTEAHAKAQDDPVRSGLVVREMRRRHEFSMNPKGAWWSQAATSAAFVYALAASPAAAVVNLTQTTIMGTPILGAAFPKAGISGAAKALTGALHDFTKGRGHAADSARLTADEKEAMAEAYRRGTIDKSQAHDLAGVGETGVEYSDRRAKVMAAISWAFHHTERMNREITYLAAYRMARDSGIDHHDAMDRAADLTWRTHFDYQGSARPRIMQGDTAKVLLVFRNFQVNMLWRLVRDVHQSLNAKDPAERREAISQLAGVTGMLFLHAGARGVWGYGIAMTIMGLFFGGGSDDAEDEVKKAVVGTLGTHLGGVVLDGLPGYLTGTDLTARIGMPDLWFRSPDRALEGEDAYQYWLSQFLGAGFGIVERLFVGAGQIIDGNVERGLETMAPKALRDLMRARRFASDGVTTMRGDSVMDDVWLRDLFKQALGFTPARLAERYDANRKLKNTEQRIQDERSEIIADYANALRRGEDVPAGVLRRLAAFNREHPTYPITGESLRASLKARLRASARNEGGISINPKLDQALRANAAPTVY